jgi:CheY-like chemotaxis protein
MRQRKVVLVVEDNDETRALLEGILTLRGYETHGVGDGEAALHWLNEGNRPSVIVLDLYMPIMDGAEFLREVGSHPELASIPVVAFSAHSGEQPAGLTAFVRKGKDDPDVLLDAIAACLKA